MSVSSLNVSDAAEPEKEETKGIKIDEEWALSYKDLLTPLLGGFLGILAGFALCWASAPWIAVQMWDRNASVFFASVYTSLSSIAWAILMGHLWSMWLVENNDEGYSLWQLHNTSKSSLTDQLITTISYSIERIFNKSKQYQTKGPKENSMSKIIVATLLLLFILFLPLIVSLFDKGPFWKIGGYVVPLNGDIEQIIDVQNEARWNLSGQPRGSFNLGQMIGTYGHYSWNLASLRDEEIIDVDVNRLLMAKSGLLTTGNVFNDDALSHANDIGAVVYKEGHTFIASTGCIPINDGKIIEEKDPTSILFTNSKTEQNHIIADSRKCLAVRLAPMDYSEGKELYDKSGTKIEDIGSYYKLTLASSLSKGNTCYRAEFVCSLTVRKVVETVVKKSFSINPIFPELTSGTLSKDEKLLSNHLLNILSGVTSVDLRDSKNFPTNITAPRLGIWIGMSEAIVDSTQNKVYDKVYPRQQDSLNKALLGSLKLAMKILAADYFIVAAANAFFSPNIEERRKKVLEWLRSIGKDNNLLDTEYDVIKDTYRVYGPVGFKIGCIIMILSLVMSLYLVYTIYTMKPVERMIKNYVMNQWKIIQNMGGEQCNLKQGESSARERSEEKLSNLRFYENKGYISFGSEI